MLHIKIRLRVRAYIRKIIQLPITIPEWNDVDIIENLVHNLSTRLDAKYRNLVDQNKEIIAKAVELNPREVKRFINSFIVAHQIFSDNPHVNAVELLIVQALKFRWNKFYYHISADDPPFRQEVQEYVKLSADQRSNKIRERKKDTKNPLKKYENIIIDFESDDKLWDFLGKNEELIFSIKDWKAYRQVVETLKEEKELIREARPSAAEGTIFKLLKEGRIKEFNEVRGKSGVEVLELNYADLSGADLNYARLSDAKLSGARLNYATPGRADLNWS